LTAELANKRFLKKTTRLKVWFLGVDVGRTREAREARRPRERRRRNAHPALRGARRASARPPRRARPTV